MWKFVATAKRALWEFVELAFLAVLALTLIFLLLGKSAGTYVVSVADNVTKFSSAASSGLLGIVIVLAIIYLALRKLKPESGITRGGVGSRATRAPAHRAER
jgi:membrane protein DedA with SNARE-associated domain